MTSTQTSRSYSDAHELACAELELVFGRVGGLPQDALWWLEQIARHAPDIHTYAALRAHRELLDCHHKEREIILSSYVATMGELEVICNNLGNGYE